MIATVKVSAESVAVPICLLATFLLKDFVEGKIDLMTMTLFSYEILSAINVAISRKRISEPDGKRALNYLTTLGIEERSFEGLIVLTST